MIELAIVVVVVTALVALIWAVRVVPRHRADVVERFGRYQRTVGQGLHPLIPFVERVRARVDLRDQIVGLSAQPVITSDNLLVSVDTVLRLRVVDPQTATYGTNDYLRAVEQLAVLTLRNVIGSLDLVRTLASREEIVRQLSEVLDETTGRWGVKVTRVEIKSIVPR
jgi:regulator of protease activity HflC (stomatin/prohibitin superfamily)